MFQENKIATQNDIQKLQSQLQEKQKTTHEITSELQVFETQTHRKRERERERERENENDGKKMNE
jgi:hypothetical protein